MNFLKESNSRTFNALCEFNNDLLLENTNLKKELLIANKKLVQNQIETVVRTIKIIECK